MKYPAETYARALAEALVKTSDKEKGNVIRRFSTLLRKTGDIARAGKIIRAFEKLTVKKGGGRWVEVEFARPLDVKLASKIGKSFAAKDRIEETINPALIAGVRVTIDGGQELDNSLARKLKKLFTPKK